jgi:hypothetical protein
VSNGPNRDRSREVNEGAGQWMGGAHPLRPYRCHFCREDSRYGYAGYWFCLKHWADREPRVEPDITC